MRNLVTHGEARVKCQMVAGGVYFTKQVETSGKYLEILSFQEVFSGDCFKTCADFILKFKRVRLYCHV